MLQEVHCPSESACRTTQTLKELRKRSEVQWGSRAPEVTRGCKSLGTQLGYRARTVRVHAKDNPRCRRCGSCTIKVTTSLCGRIRQLRCV